MEYKKHPQIPPYDEKFIMKLQNEGMSPTSSVLVASTEMEGVYVFDRGPHKGNVHGMQTYCHILRYNEDLEESKGAKDGERACLQALKDYRDKLLEEDSGGTAVQTISNYIDYVSEQIADNGSIVEGDDEGEW